MAWVWVWVMVTIWVTVWDTAWDTAWVMEDYMVTIMEDTPGCIMVVIMVITMADIMVVLFSAVDYMGDIPCYCVKAIQNMEDRKGQAIFPPDGIVL